MRALSSGRGNSSTSFHFANRTSTWRVFHPNGSIIGMFGMYEPTLRATVKLLAGQSVAEAAEGAAYVSASALR